MTEDKPLSESTVDYNPVGARGPIVRGKGWSVSCELITVDKILPHFDWRQKHKDYWEIHECKQWELR